jgi:type II secretory pathway component PulC
MIREPAAKALAQMILDPFIAHGIATQDMVESMTQIILTHVEIDETKQMIERKESVIRAIGGTH